MSVPKSGGSRPGSRRGSRPGSGLGIRSAPLLFQYAHEDGVVEALVAPKCPAEASLFPKPQLAVGGDGVFVKIEDAQADAVQAQVSERVVEEYCDGLGSVAVVPVLLMT